MDNVFSLFSNQASLVCPDCSSERWGILVLNPEEDINMDVIVYCPECYTFMDAQLILKKEEGN